MHIRKYTYEKIHRKNNYINGVTGTNPSQIGKKVIFFEKEFLSLFRIFKSMIKVSKYTGRTLGGVIE